MALIASECVVPQFLIFWDAIENCALSTKCQSRPRNIKLGNLPSLLIGCLSVNLTINTSQLTQSIIFR